MPVMLEEGETVVFSYVIWPWRQDRDEGHERMIDDARPENPDDRTIQDGKRMIFDGFAPIFEM